MVKKEVLFEELVLAVKTNNLDFVRNTLTHHNQLLYQKDSHGHTLLMLAVKKGLLAMTSLLINKQSFLQQTNKWNQTALFIAAIKNHVKILKMLIYHKANINCFNYVIRYQQKKYTPLMAAVELNKIQAVECLLIAGANYMYKTQSNIGLIECCKTKETKQIIKKYCPNLSFQKQKAENKLKSQLINKKLQKIITDANNLEESIIKKQESKQNIKTQEQDVGIKQFNQSLMSRFEKIKKNKLDLQVHTERRNSLVKQQTNNQINRINMKIKEMHNLLDLVVKQVVDSGKWNQLESFRNNYNQHWKKFIDNVIALILKEQNEDKK